MVRDGGSFLSRWSRRKLESDPRFERPVAPDTADPLPELPALDQLTPESDFTAFMHRKVDQKIRSAALKTLFSDPALNIVDGLDEYNEDDTLLEDLSAEIVAQLEHSKTTLFGRDPEEKQQEAEAAAADAAPALEQTRTPEEGASPAQPLEQARSDDRLDGQAETVPVEPESAVTSADSASGDGANIKNGA